MEKRLNYVIAYKGKRLDELFKPKNMFTKCQAWR